MMPKLSRWPALLFAGATASLLLSGPRLGAQSQAATAPTGPMALPFVWEVDAGPGAIAPPLVAGARLYVATARQAVKAFDLATGRALWSRDLGRGFQAPPRLAADLLVVAAPHPSAEAHGLDPATGSTRWTVRVGDVTQPPVVDGGRVFFVSLGGRVRAVEAATGDTLWDARLEGVFPGGALLLDESLFVLSAAGRVYRLDAASGTRQGSVELGAPAAPGLAPLPGGFLAATFDGRVRSFGPDLAPSGVDLQAEPLQHSVAATGGLLVAAGRDKRVRAFALPSGTPLWERELPTAPAAPPSISADASRIAVADLAGGVWLLSAADGSPLGRATLSGAPTTPVWAGARLAAVTDRGALALIEAGGAAPAGPVAGGAPGPSPGSQPAPQ